MKETTELKQQEELLDTTNNKDYSKLEFTAVDNSPFTIVKDENTYFGLIGNHRITGSYGTFEEIKEDITKITWDRIVQVIWAVAEKYKDIDLIKKEE